MLEEFLSKMLLQGGNRSHQGDPFQSDTQQYK